MKRTPHPLTIGFAVLVVLGLSSILRAQEPEEKVTKPPLIVEIVNGEGEQLYAHFDTQAFDKLDLILERVASLEATVLSTLDTPEDPQPDLGVNLNTASYDELLEVPGIGPVKAGSIVAERGQHGLFTGWSDFQERVSGVGPSTVADIQASGAFIK